MEDRRLTTVLFPLKIPLTIADMEAAVTVQKHEMSNAVTDLLESCCQVSCLQGCIGRLSELSLAEALRYYNIISQKSVSISGLIKLRTIMSFVHAMSLWVPPAWLLAYVYHSFHNIQDLVIHQAVTAPHP